jgi:hypothetical protein
MNLKRIEKNKEIQASKEITDAFFELSKTEPMRNFVTMLFSLGFYGKTAKWIPTKKEEIGKPLTSIGFVERFMTTADIDRTVGILKLIAFGGTYEIHE